MILIIYQAGIKQSYSTWILKSSKLLKILQRTERTAHTNLKLLSVIILLVLFLYNYNVCFEGQSKYLYVCQYDMGEIRKELYYWICTGNISMYLCI